jgi:multidrug resistance efflux pump
MTETVTTEPVTTEIDPGPAARSTRVGVLALAAFIALLLGLHLIGDRLTPYSSQGRVHANVVAVAPEVGGLVTAVRVKNNQIVRRGEILFTVGRDPYEIAAQKARADISAVGRDLAASDAGIMMAKAGLDGARAAALRSQLDAARSERIYAEDAGAISVRRLELARASAVESRAKVVAAEAQLEQARQARGLSGADNDRLIAARSALEKAELDLKRTTVVAPGDGLITDLHTDVGQFAGAGSPVMTFIAIHDGWVTLDMTENNLGRMKPGDKAELVFDVLPGKVIAGRVRSIGYGVSAGTKTAPGSLPDVQSSRDWLRQAQRFPVILEIPDGELARVPGVREGGQAEAIVYTGDNPVMNALGALYIRGMSLLSYAY